MSKTASPLSESFLHFFRRVSTRIKLWLVFLMGSGVFVAVGSGWLIYQIFYIYQNGPLVEEGEPKKAGLIVSEDMPAFTLAFELRGLNIPVTNRKGNRIAYAQFSLVFDCPSDASRRMMELSRASLLDAVKQSALAFVIEDFNEQKGFDRFKANLTAELTARFQALAPRAVALSDWVVN